MNSSALLNTTDLWSVRLKMDNQLTTAEGIIVVTVTNIVALVGAVGNFLTAIILRLHGLENSTNILLLSLAVADFMFLITSWTKFFTKYVQLFDAALAVTVDAYIYSYAMIINNMYLAISMTHIVIIAMERILAVFYPLHVNSWLTPKRMTIISIGAHLMFYSLWTPLLLISEVHWSFHPEFNQTIAVPLPTEFYLKHASSINIFYKLIMMIVLGPIYSGVVLCCCLAIGVKLRLVTQERFKMAEGQGHHGVARDRVHLKTARMLLVVCVVYLLASMPATLFQLVKTTRPSFYVDERPGYYVGLIWCLNCSVNFFIYAALSEKFKASFSGLCMCRLTR